MGLPAAFIDADPSESFVVPFHWMYEEIAVDDSRAAIQLRPDGASGSLLRGSTRNESSGRWSYRLARGTKNHPPTLAACFNSAEVCPIGTSDAVKSSSAAARRQETRTHCRSMPGQFPRQIPLPSNASNFLPSRFPSFPESACTTPRNNRTSFTCEKRYH